jgi:hypothetical protein
VLHARPLRRLGDVAYLLQFLLAREVLPEVGECKHPEGAGERLGEALDAVEVGLDHVGAGPGERLGLVRGGLPGERAGGETAVRVVQDGAGEPAALGAGRADDCDDLLVRHGAMLRG